MKKALVHWGAYSHDNNRGKRDLVDHEEERSDDGIVRLVESLTRRSAIMMI